MHIERVHQIDSSEPDASGMYDYYYEYDIYRFTARTGSDSLPEAVSAPDPVFDDVGHRPLNEAFELT